MVMFFNYMHSILPVSYTHLDVYKRQIIDSNIKRIRLYISFIRKYDEEINSLLESLDVYKRQVLWR